MNTLSIAQALQRAQSGQLERLDAQLLLLQVLGKSPQERAWLLAHDTDLLTPGAQSDLDSLVQRRLQGEPLAYITGQKEFFGLSLMVDTRVLVPRPETETLVEWTLEVLAERPAASVLDLGSGSGAIALALKHSRPDLQVLALDASSEALQVARANAQRLQLDVQFQQGAWLEGMTGRFHAIASNPPYIAAHDRHLEQLGFEPVQALVSGNDGLADIRQIIGQARAHLHCGGWLLLEHGYDQAACVRELLLGAGFQNVQSRLDASGIQRCSAGQLSFEVPVRPFAGTALTGRKIWQTRCARY